MRPTPARSSTMAAETAPPPILATAPVITPADLSSPAEQRDLVASLRKVSMFQHCSEASLLRLAKDMERVEFHPGDRLGPREGEPQTHLFVVTAGQLARWSHGRMIHTSLNADLMLGEEEAVDMVRDEGAAKEAAAAANGEGGDAEKNEIPITVRALGAGPGSGRDVSTIEVVSPDMPGLLANVSSTLKSQGVSIDKATVRTTRKKKWSKGGRLLGLFSRGTESVTTDRPDDKTDEKEGGGDAESGGGNNNAKGVQHTAYQFHEVVNAATNEPITDPAWMRRVEAAVRVSLAKSAAAANQLARQDSDEATAPRAPPEGAAVRTIDASGTFMAKSAKANAFGILQCLNRQPSFATATAVTSGVCWRLSSEKLEQALRTGWSDADRDFAVDVASGLTAEIARMGTFYSTPLLDQPVQTINIAAVSVAAAFESYYRSALNAYLNAAIAASMGIKGGDAVKGAMSTRKVLTTAEMFPNMHVQIPTRVMYINGFKLSRQWLADVVHGPSEEARNRGDERAHTAYMLIPALMPGVLMTPISSMLEACNAGHMNPEPLARRWMRGVAPRCGREIIFGLGLNNLTDWAEERIPRDVCETKVLRNALGSCVAGVIAGYFSHVPHNLSTMKLLAPQVSYRDHVRSMVRSSTDRVPKSLPPAVRETAATALALLVPKGLAIRTTQVIGSFMLLNGFSHLLDQR